MQVTRKSRLHLRAQNIIFVFLLLVATGLLAWLSVHYTWQADWSAGNRNSLSDASVKLLATLDAPISITAFARENPPLRQQVKNLVQRYQREYEQVSLTFINPNTHPAQARQKDISRDGELIIHYAGKSEHVRQLNESAITNALQRLARDNNSRILFVTGHGERAPPGKQEKQGARNFDLGRFGQALIETGFTLDTINLARTSVIPDNTSLIIIAGPQTDYLPAEVEILEQYLKRGGNLLWLAEPGSDRHGLAPLADTLDIEFLPGLAIDATSKLFGVSDPSMILVPQYPGTPLTRDFNLLTIYPQVTGLASTQKTTTNKPDSAWEQDVFLRTLARAWQETGNLEEAVQFNAETADREGPLAIGMILTRKIDTTPENEISKKENQRIVVTGDGDFLANAYLGNGGNLALGLNIINWLSHDDSYINLPPHNAPDTRLMLSRPEILGISIFFLIVLPVALLAAGIIIWWRRRRA